jgi:hypothetical protein
MSTTTYCGFATLTLEHLKNDLITFVREKDKDLIKIRMEGTNTFVLYRLKNQFTNRQGWIGKLRECTDLRAVLASVSDKIDFYCNEIPEPEVPISDVVLQTQVKEGARLLKSDYGKMFGESRDPLSLYERVLERWDKAEEKITMPVPLLHKVLPQLNKKCPLSIMFNFGPTAVPLNRFETFYQSINSTDADAKSMYSDPTRIKDTIVGEHFLPAFTNGNPDHPLQDWQKAWILLRLHLQALLPSRLNELPAASGAAASGAATTTTTAPVGDPNTSLKDRLRKRIQPEEKKCEAPKPKQTRPEKGAEKPKASEMEQELKEKHKGLLRDHRIQLSINRFTKRQIDLDNFLVIAFVYNINNPCGLTGDEFELLLITIIMNNVPLKTILQSLKKTKAQKICLVCIPNAASNKQPGINNEITIPNFEKFLLINEKFPTGENKYVWAGTHVFQHIVFFGVTNSYGENVLMDYFSTDEKTENVSSNLADDGSVFFLPSKPDAVVGWKSLSNTINFQSFLRPSTRTSSFFNLFTQYFFYYEVYCYLKTTFVQRESLDVYFPIVKSAITTDYVTVENAENSMYSVVRSKSSDLLKCKMIDRFSNVAEINTVYYPLNVNQTEEDCDHLLKELQANWQKIVPFQLDLQDPFQSDLQDLFVTKYVLQGKSALFLSLNALFDLKNDRKRMINRDFLFTKLNNFMMTRRFQENTWESQAENIKQSFDTNDLLQNPQDWCFLLTYYYQIVEIVVVNMESCYVFDYCVQDRENNQSIILYVMFIENGQIFPLFPVFKPSQFGDKHIPKALAEKINFTYQQNIVDPISGWEEE